MGRWPKQLIGFWKGNRCTISKLGCDFAEISYKGTIERVPLEEIEFKEEKK